MRASLPLFAVAVLSVFIGLSSHLAFAQQAPTLAGSEWRLEQCDGQPVPTDAVVTLTFEEGRVSGRAAYS